MALFTTVEQALSTGKKARRADWPDCKVIRRSIESDHDFFVHDVDLSEAIIESCKKTCDCEVGVWVPGEGDKEADDWVILAN